MSALKYKVGDRVKIKSLDWYNKNKNSNGDVVVLSKVSHFSWCENVRTVFTKDMVKFCGKVVTIETVWTVNYSIVEGTYRDGINIDYFTDEMIECLVEEEIKPKFKVGDKVLCRDGCPGEINSIDTHEGQIRYDVTFGGGVDFGYYREKDLIEYHKPEYITGDFVGIYGYETDVKIQQMKWDGAAFIYKVYLADGEEWITADDIAYKVEKDKTPVISGTIKATLLSARDRGRIDEIIKALKFLEEDKMICYADEIEFLKKIRSW